MIWYTHVLSYERARVPIIACAKKFSCLAEGARLELSLEI